uniref:Uncharacterized protein n=1 Tax=Rhizophagus irregularis (strain DAOM 181602 / DAOM 197198 / MUCL 43194) TaxID=747089 RepID=U9SNR1_RHIID
MELILEKVKRYSGDAMNEMADELAKSTGNSNHYFNNRFNYSNRTTLMNTRVAAEWSILKTNEYETPIDWNITWNLIHRYKGFNCISVKKHWHLIFITKLFAKLLPIEESRYHFIECDANKKLWPIIKNKMQNDLVPIIQKLNDSPENTSKIISEKLNQILGSQHDNNKFTDFCLLALEAKINTNFSKISKQTFGLSESKTFYFWPPS